MGVVNIEDTLKELELSLLTEDVRSSRDRLDELIADDFVEFGSSGHIFYKASIIDELLRSLTNASYEAKDIRVYSLSEDVAQVRFVSTHLSNDGKQVKALRSSLWKNSDKGWQMFFHQGTKVE